MDKFIVGQMVRVIKADLNPKYLGMVVEILKKQTIYRIIETGQMVVGYAIDIDENGRLVIACEEALRPVYDGGEGSTWSECIWKPKDLRVKEGA